MTNQMKAWNKIHHQVNCNSNYVHLQSKKNEIMGEIKWNSHHIVPRSRWWSNNTENLKSMKENIHVWFHQVFRNELPHEQIKTLLDINHTALTRIFRKELFEILRESDDDGWIYKKWVFIKK